jgi:hypothetical protein
MQFVRLQTLRTVPLTYKKHQAKNYESTANLRHQQNTGRQYFNF